MRRAMFLALVLGLAASSLDAGDVAFETQLKRRLRTLGSDAGQVARIEALEWVRVNTSQLEDARATAAVDKCLTDADLKVRAKAIEVRAQLALGHRTGCPVRLFELLADADAEVREQAVNWTSVFPAKGFPQEAAPALLKAISSPHAEVRTAAIALLPMLPQKEPAVAALRKATEDKDFLVQQGARSALFRISGNFDDVVPHQLKLRIELRDASRIQTGRRDPKEQAAKNLMALGATTLLRNLAEERPNDFAKYLVGQLQNKDAAVRRATALYLADTFQERANPPQPKWNTLLPYIEGSTPPGIDIDINEVIVDGASNTLMPFEKFAESEANRKKRLAGEAKQTEFVKRLDELAVQKRLLELRDRESEPLVRGAAGQALWQLEALRKKGQVKQQTPLKQVYPSK